jgi:hypothetical protein
VTAPLVIEVEVSGLPVQVEVASTAAIVSPGPPVAVLVAVPGARGQQGLPGTGVPILGETPAGVQDDVNLVFTTAAAYQANTTAVFVNGLREQRDVSYVETDSTTITFTTAPSSVDVIAVDYIIG